MYASDASDSALQPRYIPVGPAMPQATKAMHVDIDIGIDIDIDV